MRPYKKILVISVVMAIFLYWYDHKQAASQQLTLKQQALEIVIWGSVYTVSIFVVASLMYFLVNVAMKLMKRRV
jgi:hypothetical protein